MKRSAVIFIITFLIVSTAASEHACRELAFAQDDIEKTAYDQSLKDELMKSAQNYYDDGKYQVAIRLWEEVLKVDPENKTAAESIEKAKADIGAEASKAVNELPPNVSMVAAAPAPEPKKKSSWGWFRGLFGKETGLVSVTSPPKEGGAVFTLKDCIDIAVNNHLPLQIAKKNMKLAEMRLWEARRNMLPTVTLNWQENYGRVNSRMYYGKKENVEGQQPVFRGGELYFTMKQAEVNLEITKKDYQRIKNDLILQVKKAYYTLSKAKENLTIQTMLSQEVENIYDMVQKEFEAGVISRIELLNVSSQYGQVRFQLVSASGDESVAELILKQAMNLEPKDTVDIAPRLEFRKIEVDFEEVLKAAMIHRPEMRINSFMIDYYNLEKNIAKAKYWPKVDMMGSWGLAKEEYTSEDLGTDPDRRMEQEYYAGIKASMPFWGSTIEVAHTKEQWQPVVNTVHATMTDTNSVKIKILDALKTYSDKQLADIDLDRARQEYIKAKQDITLEAREGCFNYEKALIQLATSENKVKYQEGDLELMRLRRGMDEVQDSNLVESMIKLGQEKFGYVQALTDCYISVASLNKAIGIEDYFKVEDIVKRGDAAAAQ